MGFSKLIFLWCLPGPALSLVAVVEPGGRPFPSTRQRQRVGSPRRLLPVPRR